MKKLLAAILVTLFVVSLKIWLQEDKEVTYKANGKTCHVTPVEDAQIWDCK